MAWWTVSSRPRSCKIIYHQQAAHTSRLLPKAAASRSCCEYAGSNRRWGGRKAGDGWRAPDQGIPWFSPPAWCLIPVPPPSEQERTGERKTKPDPLGWDVAVPHFRYLKVIFSKPTLGSLSNKANGEILSVLRRMTTIPGLKPSQDVPLIPHWYRWCPDDQCLLRLHLNEGCGSTPTGQGPAALLLAAPTRARHKFLLERAAHALTQAEAPLAEPPRRTTQVHTRVQSQPWLLPGAAFQRTESKLLYCIFEDICLRNRTPDEQPFHYMWVLLSREKHFELPPLWGGTLTWPWVSLSNLLTNLLVQVCGIKNTKPLSHSLLLKVNKCSQLHPIIAVFHQHRAVNWWHHQANFIKHKWVSHKPVF